MTTKIIKCGKPYFQCNECGFMYENENLAKKCEDYCKKHHACSMEITKYAIQV